MNMYDGKSPNDFITFEMMGTEHEFPQQNVHVSLGHNIWQFHAGMEPWKWHYSNTIGSRFMQQKTPFKRV